MFIKKYPLSNSLDFFTFIILLIIGFLTYKDFHASIKGLEEFDEELWPTNIPGLYYAYHIMENIASNHGKL